MSGEHQHLDYEARMADIELSVAALAVRVTTLETPPPPPMSTFPIAWWNINSTPTAIDAHVAAGFTHCVCFSATRTYLDNLHAAGVKAVTGYTTDKADHPAVVAWIIYDEPDNLEDRDRNTATPPAAVSPATIALIAANTRAADTRNLPLFLVLGPAFFAGPHEVSPPDYFSLGALRSTDYPAYVESVDMVAAQCYTAAGDPDKPRYRNSAGTTITASQAGARNIPGAVAGGVARAKRLVPALTVTKPLWVLLAATKYNGLFGRKPTLTELELETQAAVAGGCAGVLWFEQGVGGGIPVEALVSDPAQLAVVTEINANLREASR